MSERFISSLETLNNKIIGVFLDVKRLFKNFKTHSKHFYTVRLFFRVYFSFVFFVDNI